nr:hypothetical protein [Bradyrhizobium canariense]
MVEQLTLYEATMDFWGSPAATRVSAVSRCACVNFGRRPNVTPLCNGTFTAFFGALADHLTLKLSA